MSEIASLSWDDLDVVPGDTERPLFAAEVRWKNFKGEVLSRKVRLRVPTPLELISARRKARDWCAELGIDPVKDPEILAQTEDLVVLSEAIREYEAPHGQWDKPQVIAQMDQACLRDLKERIAHFTQLVDPRIDIQTDEQFWAVIAEVKRKKNLLPLADIAGHVQPSFIMRMAWEASKSPTAPSSLRSSESSTPEP